MSNHHVEDWLGDHEKRESESPLGEHVRPSAPRTGATPTSAAPAPTSAAPTSAAPTSASAARPDAVTAKPATPSSGGSLRSSSSLRNRPHGVRAQQPDAVDSEARPLSRRPGAPVKPAKAAPGPLGLPALPAISMPSFHRPTLHRPDLHRPTLHRPHWPLSIRQTFAVGGAVVLIAAVVSALVVVIPNKPVAAPNNGSVRDLVFRAAGRPPTGAFDYGPYFASDSSRLLMVGTDAVVTGGKTLTTTTTVWSSTDGSTWDVLSSPGSFSAEGRRFVVQGFASDGNDGFVAVGDATGSDAMVEPQAWHSRDGVNWTAANIDFQNNVQMIGLASRPGQIVSAGNGVAWFSADGSSWKLMPLPDAVGYLPRVVRAWAGGFVILGISSGTDAPHTAAWISTDGREWNKVPDRLDGFRVQDVAAYGNGLVAVGSQVLTAEELATPTPTPSPTPSTSPTPTPKPTPTSKPAASGASPSPSASPVPTARPRQVEVATAWISPDGYNWYRSNAIGNRSLVLESITQVFDSLVAVGSQPGAIAAGASLAPSPTEPGATPTPAVHASLWTTEDGLNWRAMPTDAEPLSRSRLAPFGSSLVMAGFDQSGRFAVQVGSVTLGSPPPQVEATPTPPFSIDLKQGTTPMVPNLTENASLGPVIVVASRFVAFVNDSNGATAYSSTDGKTWTVLGSAAQIAGSTATPASSASGAPPAAATATPASSASGNVATVATGTPAVAAAVEDGQGGLVAVGSVAAQDGETTTAAIWRYSGSAWTQAAISAGDAVPAGLDSVAMVKGTYVATASTAQGARVLFSRDGATWQPASLSSVDGYNLTVASWSGGLIASGANSAGKSAVWTSTDGEFWISEATWKLPANLTGIYGTRNGLVATTASFASGTSWWWSSDGRSWQDTQLTSSGGCSGALDTGIAVISLSASSAAATPPPEDTPTPKPTKKPTGSVAPTPSPTIGFAGGWQVWASKDSRTWQMPAVSKFGFDGASTCRMATSQGKVVIIGWARDGVLRAFYGTVNGL